MEEELDRVARTRLLNPEWIEGKKKDTVTKGDSNIRSCIPYLRLAGHNAPGGKLGI